MIWRSLFYIIFFLSISLQVISQRENYSYYFTNYKLKSLQIPFEMVNNVIIISISVNGSDTLRFILDSGVRTPILTKVPQKDSARFTYIQVENIYGLGLDDPVEAFYSPANYFNISGLKRKHVNALILKHDIFQLGQELGTQVHGLVGYDIFKDVIVEIDYFRKRITFHDPNYYRPTRSKKAVTIPLEIIKSKPYISTQVRLHNDSLIDVKLLLDTGASLALWLSQESNPDIVLPENTIEEYIGKGLNGEIHGRKGKIKTLYLGKYKLKHPVTSFPDSAAVLKTIRQEERNGSVGQEILRRFTVIFNYQGNEVTLIPNPDFKDSFKYNLSGVTFTNEYPGLPIYSVSKVRKNSPADEAGLKVDDQLISINGLNHKDITLSDVNYYLQSRDGKKIKLSVLRAGEKIKTQLVLKDEL